jgi:hypothetical protein
MATEPRASLSLSDLVRVAVPTVATLQAEGPLLREALRLAEALEAIGQADLAHQLLTDCQGLGRTLHSIGELTAGPDSGWGDLAAQLEGS